MVEGIVTPVPSYENLIREAFIDPIRTVVVVDDEFPTLDALLDKELNGSSPGWKKENVTLARSMVNFCRNSERRWLLEISDGRLPTPPADDLGASHLHHSDLIILDYHLDGENSPTDGTLAIDILRNLARNNHFNLVVVYTKGYEGAGNQIERVAMEIAVGLCSTDGRLNQNQRLLDRVRTYIGEWEDTDDGIEGKLIDAIDDRIYLTVRQKSGAIDWKGLGAQSELHQFRELMASAPEGLAIENVLKWGLHKRQELLRDKLMPADRDQVEWHWEPSGLNWIRTDRLFVTIIGKSSEPGTIPDSLLAALRRWNPPPHRLLMSKMRAVLDDRGVLAEGEVLSDKLLQRGWLKEFLTVGSDEWVWKIHHTITRHWEGMADVVRSEVVEFARHLASYFLGGGVEKAIEEHTPLVPGADEGDVTCAVNRYTCSIPVAGHHLTTGHVLKILADGKGTAEYWLCLSPACDLVPNRERQTGWRGKLDSHVPFIVVRLFLCDPDIGLSRAAGGGYLFLNIDGSTEVFGLADEKSNRSGLPHVEPPNPKWELMFAEAEAVFADKFTLKVKRVMKKQDTPLALESSAARVVAQLRYEYALNLLQRLGMNLSRIGLDFVSFLPAVNSGQADA